MSGAGSVTTSFAGTALADAAAVLAGAPPADAAVLALLEATALGGAALEALGGATVREALAAVAGSRVSATDGFEAGVAGETVLQATSKETTA